MPALNQVLAALIEAIPAIVALFLVVVSLLIARRILDRIEGDSKTHRLRDQVIMLGLTGVGFMIVVLALPLGDTLRGQLLGFVGLLLSAAIALSSTTLLGNALAGAMLRVERNFRIGDFIQVGEHLGRVTERGLFHTEIQNVDRQLVTLPNLYLATSAVYTVRKSGTVVAATVSLGYDIPRKRIEKLLLEAAESCELTEPFVQIEQLGDYSVTYRVAGLLSEVNKMISTRSRLRGRVMDALHGGGVEIVSPNFMNQRRLQPDERFIPLTPTTVAAVEEDDEGASAEHVIFDKADMAETKEALKARRAGLVEELETLKEAIKTTEDPAEKERLERRADEMERMIGHLAKLASETEDE